MSSRYYYAAADLRLPWLEKYVAIGLGNFADVDGVTSISNGQLRRWSGLSEQSVRRALRALSARRLAVLSAAADPKSSTAAQYKLHYPGARQEGPSCLTGSSPPTSQIKNLLPVGQDNDRSLILKSSTSRKAGTAGAAPVENVGNEPTTKQVTKFVHELMADNRYDHQTLNADLTADMKSLLRTRNFDYDTPLGLENLRKGIDSGLAQYARAKGQQR